MSASDRRSDASVYMRRQQNGAALVGDAAIVVCAASHNVLRVSQQALTSRNFSNASAVAFRQLWCPDPQAASSVNTDAVSKCVVCDRHCYAPSSASPSISTKISRSNIAISGSIRICVRHKQGFAGAT